MIRSVVLGAIAAFAIACSGSAASSSNDDDTNGSASLDAGNGEYATVDGSVSRSDGGGASRRDAGSALDSSVTTGTTRVDGGTETGVTNGVDDALTFSGDCSPDMENLDVVTNTSSYDSLGVVNGSDPTDGDVQIAVNDGSLSVVALSTAERVGPPNNEVVINVMSGGVVFTNVCNLSAGGCTYDASTKTYDGDPITGTFTINQYDPESGRLDVGFDGVVLQSTQSTAVCRVNGTLTTQHLYP